MKENRDPRANRVMKICEHLAEATAKQRQRLQSGGTIPKRRRSTTKRNDENPTRPKSRSHHWQTVTSSESSRNWDEQYRTESTVIYSRRSRPSEVIHALKEIINNVREDEDVEENAVNVSNNDVFNNKEDDNELQTLPNCDISAGMSQNDEVYFTKNKHFDEPNQPFDQSICKSTSTQTEESLDSKEVLKLTQIAKQSSPNCNNVIETGCNTMHYNAIYKNAEVSCDLIDSTNSKTDIDSTEIEDKTPTLEDVPVHTESIKCAENSTEDEYSDKSKKLLVSECKQTLNTETLKLDYDVMETPAKTENNFIRDEEEIIDENSQTFLKLSKNSDDKTNIDIDTHPESTKYSNDSGDNSFSEKSHRPSSSIYDYDASCSSEELAEYLENDVQYRDIAMSELKMENIPSDMIATLELAAERARNLQKAIIIYYENLIPGRAEKRDEETAEDYETVERCASFPSCEIGNRERSECDAKYCRFDATNGEDIDRFSACSSKSGNSVRMCEPALQKLSLADYCELLNQEEERAILPREKAIAKSSLNERSDLAEVKSLMQLLVHRSQEEYALEMLQSEEDENDGEDFEAAGAIKTLALPMTIEKTPSIISRENLLPLIYCILCSVVFWYLQFSFRCDPAT
ncbi:hypothetical protein RF55_7087 [Lasius niger]|uniref:Uncharacterized protein n=1 Tax=Lasius niger TaxID=67767 RepID=A0A0J7NK62_LASNI|nr:hypothetical protein RF55_7087 [Lasius niger]